MAIFQYEARDLNGKMVKGRLEAASKDAVTDQLVSRGIIPLRITPISSFEQLLDVFRNPGKVPLDEMSLFCRQMHALIKAGVPITNALMRLSETSTNKTLKKLLDEIATKIAEGKTLAKSFADFPRSFPPVVTNVIDAGENSGRLDLAFMQLSKFFELESVTLKRLKSALRYPIIVVVAILGAIFVINFMVIPAFAQFFAQFNAELPLPTRILMATSNFLVANWKLLVLIIFVALFSVRSYLMTHRGRITAGYVLIRIPIVGNIMHRIVLARFARIFTMIMRAGVPIVKGIELASNAVGNAYIQQYFVKMKDSISHGESLTKAADQTKLFSPLVLQMLAVGEETGQVDDMLEEVAEFYEREVDYDLSRLSSMLEPLMLGILGIMVLILALGVFLPMWNMADFARR